MKQGVFIKRSVLLASAAALAAAYGCERPNPNKAQGDASAVYGYCETPSTGSGALTTTGGNNNTGTTGGTTTGGTTSGSTGSGSTEQPTQQTTELDQRELDFSEALRVASILVLGDAPKLDDMMELGDLPDDAPDCAKNNACLKRQKYEEMIDEMLGTNGKPNDPRFAATMVDFFHYTFKMGGNSSTPGEPNRDTAPNFAARVVYEGKDWRDILTATSNTCPTYNAMTGTFADGSCTNTKGMIPTTGVLTDPGIMSFNYGNLGFKRNRFFHETFLCRNANDTRGGEPDPSKKGGETACKADATSQNEMELSPDYSNAWPLSSIADKCNGGGISFHTWTASVTCANCHATWNHRSPLLSVFDSKGMYVAPTGSGPNKTFAVHIPVTGDPFAKMSDWLCVDPAKCPDAANTHTAWKHHMTVNGVLKTDPETAASDLVELGKRMTEDDEVIDCTVKRIWNFAMGRGDITEMGGIYSVDLGDVDPNDSTKHPNPAAVRLKNLTDYFKGNNYNLKLVLRKILVSDDFVRF
jgi:hypothetical protein